MLLWKADGGMMTAQHSALGRQQKAALDEKWKIVLFIHE
tara:strand:- start:252 stop:368 length:117 start_codon:yes stop_codon:yes gene_type:complete